MLRLLGLGRFREGNVYVLAVGGHVASGKSTFSQHLIEKMRLEDIPINSILNFKLRPTRPSEIDGIDYNVVESEQKWSELKERGEIGIEFTRDGIRYGFPKTFLEALHKGGAHQLVNLDIAGLVALSNYFTEHGIENSIIPIGLYCSEEEARQRIVGREPLTGRDIATTIAGQLNTLPAQMARYGKNPEHFRYLFYDSVSVASIDHLVARTIDLFRREEKYHLMGNETFRQQYVTDQVAAAFGMPPEDLEGRLTSGEKPKLRIEEAEYQRYVEIYGPVELSDLKKASERVAIGAARAYGVLTVLLDEANQELIPQEQLKNRKILQRLLEIMLGIPQYVNAGSTLLTENISRVGLVDAGSSPLSFLISFSPYDVLPLVATHGRMPDAKSPLHTLSFEYAYPRGGNLTLQPIPYDLAPRYAARPMGNGS